MAPSADVPTADPRWSTHGGPQTIAAPTAPRPAARTAPGWQQRPAPRLQPGFRWIAVRPGAAPPQRRRRRPLGPTPRYAVIPRWGLSDRVEQAPAPAQAPVAKAGPSAPTVRTTLFLGVLALGIVALLYVLRYVLLIVNRSMLLPSAVAFAADWLGILASVVAIGVLILCLVVLIRWLIARRAAAFAHYGIPDHRSTRALWAGCLVPVVNLFWAPVYVIELATLETRDEHYQRLQRPIILWWLVWVLSNVVSTFAILTSWATDAQGIANNTVWMVFAYLFAAATVAAVAKVFEGFEQKPIARPAHRWVVLGSDGPARPSTRASARQVELDGQEPAA
jgi:Domain of unknown function (DUF4328)